MPVDQGIYDSVSSSNFKNAAEMPITVQNILLNDMISNQRITIADSQANQRNMFAIREGMISNFASNQKVVDSVVSAALSAALHKFSTIDIQEAVATNKVGTGNDLGAIMSALSAVVAGTQQSMKGAQSTPPETAKV